MAVLSADSTILAAGIATHIGKSLRDALGVLFRDDTDEADRVVFQGEKRR